MQITNERFGLDISRWQGSAPNLVQARNEGIEYVIIKATESNNWTDPNFASNLKRAREAGLLVAAYHYQRPVSAASQIARIKQVVPRDVPVILDVEGGSGNVSLTRELYQGLLSAGYRSPLLYLPRWYWQQIGSPSLAGLPPLWSSRYPDNVQDSYKNEYADVPASYWSGYGGLGVGMLQFTSSGRVAGYAPLDVNAFKGTRQQLEARFLGGSVTPEPLPTIDEEYAMVTLRHGSDLSETLVVPSSAKKLVISFGYLQMQMRVKAVKFMGPTPAVGHNELAAHGEQLVDAARPYVLDVPAGALTAEILYDYPGSGQHNAVAGFRS